MTTTIEPRAARTSVTDQPRLQKRPRVKTEAWSWYFMRISGLILLFLALGHFFMTHILHDVTQTNSAFVEGRWQNPLWRLYDWALLALGLFHGANGLRFIMDDYIRVPWKRAATKAAVYGIIFAMFAYGTITVLTFKS
jgi:succinate dehydrogenase / fumarate reductase, membrane anchor subunit